ncbi:hypothetical protein RJ640_010007 [Escallonia rubra]|uniref:Uncharacterized protein n=1 Tax=Escallonia rubra TaxID=112253 RepID=A0AA88UGW8_9ASTE|nr:hypothetical protein RJ640_010007 [Escallonia rubra]
MGGRSFWFAGSELGLGGIEGEEDDLEVGERAEEKVRERLMEERTTKQRSGKFKEIQAVRYPTLFLAIVQEGLVAIDRRMPSVTAQMYMEEIKEEELENAEQQVLSGDDDGGGILVLDAKRVLSGDGDGGSVVVLDA